MTPSATRARPSRTPLIILVALVLLHGATVAGPAAGLTLEHWQDPEFGRLAGGDGQSGIVGRPFPEPLRVLVRGDDGGPAAGVDVLFEMVSPEERSLGVAVTASDGTASLTLAATDRAGPHTVVARLAGAGAEDAWIVFELEARKGNWAVMLVFGLAGGLGLFLFGMAMMSQALQRSAGSRMRAILSALTVNRFVGVAVGAFVTMVIQSSSATTVMLVSFAQARLMGLVQTLGVILGADIGTTVTAQLIAFKLTDYALMLIGLGFVLRYAVRRPMWRNLGEVVLGFGMLFFGMHLMSEVMAPLRNYLPFLRMIASLENPLLGILAGTAFTALIQSSSAFTGIVIVLAQQGVLTLNAGIPLILGANIGTCITAGLAAIGGSREAIRVATAHTLFKVGGVLLMIWWIPSFADFVRGISPGGGSPSVDPAEMARTIPRQVANAHTIFNVGLALVFLPFTGLFARGIRRLVPDRPEAPREWFYQARHLDPDMVKTPALALNLAKVEILRLGEKVRGMAVDSLQPFLAKDRALVDRLHEEERKVDALDEQITGYLLQISQQSLSDDQAREVYMMLHVTKQFEHMADIVDKQIRPLAVKMITAGVEFSRTGRMEVESYHLKMCKQISRALETFREESLELAVHMKDKQKGYIALEEGYRQAHFERIHQAIAESMASSEIHLELMDCYRHISSYSTNVGRAILSQDRFVEPEDDLD